ncbi:integrase core domain-containing protein [Bordetella pertussis]|nr:integrase core domain-containing protein [Bordetella pertussis]
MIETIRQGLQADGITVSIAKLCRWFNVPRRTVYYSTTGWSARLAAIPRWCEATGCARISSRRIARSRTA